MNEKGHVVCIYNDRDDKLVLAFPFPKMIKAIAISCSLFNLVLTFFLFLAAFVPQIVGQLKNSSTGSRQPVCA